MNCFFRVINPFSAVQQTSRSADEKLKELQAELRYIEYDIENMHRSLTECRENIEVLENKIKQDTNELEKLIEEQNLFQFWENSFGKSGNSMRDFLFQDSLQELNLNLKNSLDYLCDTGTDYHELDTSLDNNFSFIGSDYGKRSSGERKRTALALFFSLVELTRARSNHETQFIILDEIFDALDASGQEAAHKLIMRLHYGSEYSPGIKKVFVITHSPITAGLCHSIRVEKSSSSGTQFFLFPISSLVN